MVRSQSISPNPPKMDKTPNVLFCGVNLSLYFINGVAVSYCFGGEHKNNRQYCYDDNWVGFVEFHVPTSCPMTQEPRPDLT